MRKIINGKGYNTEKAESIGTWTSTEDLRSSFYTREELFRKRSGEFFLYGKGNGKSPYAIVFAEDNMRRAGERIIPLTIEDAKKWVEDKLEAEEYVALFGEVDDDI